MPDRDKGRGNPQGSLAHAEIKIIIVSDTQFSIHDPSAEAEEEDNENCINTGPDGCFESSRHEEDELVLQEADDAGKDEEKKEAQPSGTPFTAQ